MLPDGPALCATSTYEGLFHRLLEEKLSSDADWADAASACQVCPLLASCAWSVLPGVFGLNDMHQTHGR